MAKRRIVVYTDTGKFERVTSFEVDKVSTYIEENGVRRLDYLTVTSDSGSVIHFNTDRVVAVEFPAEGEDYDG